MARIKIQDLPRGVKLNTQDMRAVTGGLSSFQGLVVEALNSLDQSNMDLLNQIIAAANSVSGSAGSTVTLGSSVTISRRKRKFPL